MTNRTSTTHPLRVDFVPRDAHGLPGQLGMTFAPGKKAAGIDGHWQRDLTADLARLRGDYGVHAIVSLIEDHELDKLGIQDLATATAAAGIALERYPIPDGGIPAETAKFAELVSRTVARVRAGEVVVIHCRGGLGRTGVLAAACLRALGVEADRAMSVVRAARQGTIENAAQEAFIRTVAVVADQTESSPSLSRVQGCLLGGALGDSLGEPVEFIRSASDIKARFGSNAPAKLGYARGPFITDDTQMTLFAAEGILRAGEDRFEDRGTAVARSVQGAFLRWLTTQDGGSPDAAGEPAGWLVTEPGLHHRRAPGNTCLSALQAQLGSGRLPAIGSVLNSSKGCGAVMRSAPFGLAARTREQAFRWARDTGAITHGHPSGYLSAAHFAAVIWGVSRGEPLLAAIERASLLLTPEAGAAETRAAVARALSLVGHGVPSAATIESLGGAWVGEEALAIALLCAATCEGSKPSDVTEALWRSVAHAGDSDSTGSLVGNLLGAMHGVEALPAAWVGELELATVIDKVAIDLHSMLDGRVDEQTYPPAAPPRKMEWYGVIDRDKYSADFVATRDALADAARRYDWTAVFALLEENPSFVNSWRVGGPSWYTPLHQAARGGAPANVVERLLALGAWRTLPTAKGERAVDIARKHGHAALISLLEPPRVRVVELDDLARIQAHFHEVIRGRIRVIEGIERSLRLPELGPLTEYARAECWFPVPGMYGGFRFWLASDAPNPKLLSESWCRVVGGSGERHEITRDGARLVDEGFV